LQPARERTVLAQGESNGYDGPAVRRREQAVHWQLRLAGERQGSRL
jgi:hypothetical protein